MKKLQNYLMKPDLLKRKLDKPSFRHDFVEWSKNNLHINKDSQSKPYRSRSPNDNHKSFQSHFKAPQSSQTKENIRCPNTLKATSVTKKNPDCRLEKQRTGLKHPNSSTNYPKKNPSKTVNTRLSAHQKNSRSISNFSDLLKKPRNPTSSSSSIHKPLIKSAQASVNELFQETPPALKLSYSYRTRQGVLASNPKKTNQDSLLIKTKLIDTSSSLFVVADGHGTYGHLVSQIIAKNIAKLTQQNLKLMPAHETLPKVYNSLQNIISNSEINASCSGSTLVTVLLEGNSLTCANVGDSRAILARQIDKKSWEMIYLSQDHKPSLELQKKRILKLGGRIHAFKDERGNPVGPLRVWLPNQNMQGLAMSRSLGDNISKPIGVIHNPEIIQISLDKRDKFLLIASDGVWQFISNHEVLQLIVPYHRENKLEEACDALLKLAYERWTVEDHSVIDDITFILIFLSV